MLTSRFSSWVVFSLFTAFTLVAGTENDAPSRGPRSAAALFISEYIEGSSNNKALEFFNPTDSAIDLAADAYVVMYYFNGSTSATNTISLTGTIASGETFVLAHASAAQAILDVAQQTDSNSWFNGDDAVELRVGGATGSIIDSIGKVGEDPGSEWGTGDTSTANNSIRRLASVCAGDSDSSDAFDPSTEFTGFAQDTFDGLGAHENECIVRELFISEYIEGSSNNKAIELFNPSNATVDLAADEYLLLYFFNGSATAGTTITLTGTIAPGGTYVIANSSSAQTILDVAQQTAGGSWFNGDDAVVLLKGGAKGATIDVIGQVGFDPGSEWGTGDVSTANNSIRRNASVCAGDTNPDDAFDPSTEWTGFAQDTFDGLGAHAADCFVVTNEPIALECNGPASVVEGEELVHEITASDADGTIDTFAITNTDPAPGAGTISLQNTGIGTATVTVSSEVPAGTYTVTISVSNTDGTPQTAECDLVITVAGIVSISAIQGNGTVSPYEGQLVATSGNIVTAIKADGFFIQTPDANVDKDNDTSEGIFVYTGGAPSIALGDEVKVVGDVTEYFGLTEINGMVTVDVLSSGNDMPAAKILDASHPSPVQPVSEIEMERYEGMLVSFSNGVASSGTDNFGDVSVVASSNRAFREPGILYPGLPDLPVWDGNPEIFEIDPNGLADSGDVEFIGGTPIVEASGPLTYSFSDYQILPKTLNLGARKPDEKCSGCTPTPRPVRDRNVGEVTIGSQNMLRFFDDIDDGNGTTETTETYQIRLAKFSLHFRELMKSPDIIALQEVENIQVLQDLAARIHSDDSSLNYTAYLEEGNDVGGIDVGFLVRDTVTVDSVTQYHKDTTYDYDGTTPILHDRPPLVLVGSFNDMATAFPIQVMNVHHRSLSGIEGSDGDRIRHKRLAQAEDTAGLIQTLQNNGMNNLVVVGDYNAFEFTDGYVDVLGIMTGNLDPQGALLPGTDLISPNLTNQVLSVDASDRYSFLFDGYAQVLDHVLTSQALNPAVREMQYIRGNSDYPAHYDGIETTPVGCSDHDGPVLFLEQPFIAVTPTSGLQVAENGTTDTFTVVLATEPNANVTVAVSSGDTGEITVSPSSLTFTSANWNTPQTVTLTGVADGIIDGDQAVTISLGPAVSGDGNYNGLTVESVSATNEDRTVDITVTPTSGLLVDESGSTDSFTLVLDVEPTANVVIPVSSGDTGEITVSTASLTFTTGNWNVPQTVTLTGVADSIVDGDEQVTISLGPATSSDKRYNGFDVDDVTAVNENIDSYTTFKLIANPGEHIQIIGDANALVGLYYFNEGTQEWVFIENVQLDNNGIGFSQIFADPDTFYGIGGPNGLQAPVNGVHTVPTLGEWGLIAFVIGLMAIGLVNSRKRRTA